MKKRQLRRDTATEIERKRERLLAEKTEFALQRREMDAEANRGYHFKDTTVLRLHAWHIPKKHTLSFMVMLDRPLQTAEVKRRLFRAFGDLRRKGGDKTG